MTANPLVTCSEAAFTAEDMTTGEAKGAKKQVRNGKAMVHREETEARFQHEEKF